VNSLKRLRLARNAGAHSADGTFVAYGPDVNIPKVAKWMRTLATERVTDYRAATLFAQAA